MAFPTHADYLIIGAGIYIYIREKARDQYIATETPVRR